MVVDKKKYEALIKFANGNYSWNDFLVVENLFAKVNQNEEVKLYLKNQLGEYIKSSSPNDGSLQKVYERVEYHILLEEKKASQKRWVWNFYRQAAAILLIPVLALSLWYFFIFQPFGQRNLAWVEIHAPNSARIHFSLPDGSEGWLNNGSSLKYHPDFARKRQVTLTGEAWLNVNPSHREFSVNTAHMDISVLGTTFTVSAYPDDDFTHVVLTEGKLQAKGRSNNFDRIIAPGERLTLYPSENKYNVRTVNTKLYTAWTSGLLVLDNEPLELAVARLERWYNVDIILDDDVLKAYRFKATFEDEPLEEVLKLLSLSTPIDYRIDRRVEDSNGIYLKRTVRMKLKKL